MPRTPMTDDERKARAKAKRDAKRAVREAQIAQIERYAGEDLAYSFRTMVKNVQVTDLPSLLATLAEGVTVTTHCQSEPVAPATYGNWQKHRIQLNPDGSIDLLDHPDAVIDPEAELFLSALGATTRHCVAAAIHLPSRTLAPNRVPGHRQVNTNLRALHTAVAWAQIPDHEWTANFGDTHLRYGITPAVQAEWDAAGWDRDQALLFQQTYTNLAVAEAWRTDGQMTKRAAALAGRGEHPNEEQRWADAGFTPSQSAKWRKMSIPPEQAYEWERHKIAPTMVARVIEKDQNGTLSIDIVKEWCSSGIPSAEVFAWYSTTNGDLAEALVWKQAKIRAWAHSKYKDYNKAHPQTALVPQVVGQYRRAFMPDNPSLIAGAIKKGISPERYQHAVRSLRPGNPDGDVLYAAILQAGEHSNENEWWPTHNNDQDRQTTARYVRSSWADHLPKFILGWLATHNDSATAAR